MTECSDLWSSGTQRKKRGRDKDRKCVIFSLNKTNCIDLMLLSVDYIFTPAVLSNFFSPIFAFQVSTSEALPASMFIPVPSPEREAQTTPHATTNSSSEDTKKQAG